MTGDPGRIRRLLAAHDPNAATELRASLDALPSRDRDAWWDTVLGVDAFPQEGADLPRGCVPYLPCPVDVVLRAIDRACVTRRDVFVDIGSGVGRVAALIHFLTGAGAVGIEIQAELAARSRALAAAFNAARLATVEGDAAELTRFLQNGSVFFFYCPFSGARLERVLDQLEDVAKARPIQLCCVQLPALERPWLQATFSDEELAIYRSRSSGLS